MTNPYDNPVREIARANCLTSGDVFGILIIVAMMIFMYHVVTVRHLNDALQQRVTTLEQQVKELQQR